MSEHQGLNRQGHRAENPQDLQRPKARRRNLVFDTPQRIHISYYTDPLCCWSWAFEEPWRKLLDEFDDSIEYRYVMCGMIPDWKSYNDPMNSVSKPIQMGPVWMHAAEVTQVKMKHSIWFEDPPSSSYPSCIAVKTAALQSEAAADKLLSLIRKALMEEGKNVSRQEVLFELAAQIDGDNFNLGKFLNDWKEQKGIGAFRDDVKTAKFHNIGRYPTLTFTNKKGQGMMITGYRPYETLRDSFLFASAELRR
jgi:putative protein-disulfide isomerase